MASGTEARRILYHSRPFFFSGRGFIARQSDSL
jgi:hypothetical protein